MQLKSNKAVYEFGPFRLDPSEHTLMREGRPVSLPPKVFDILTVLVENSGHLIGKDELMQVVWPDSFVEEGNLARNISTLRTALGESADEHKYIETVPKRGYRFVASTRQVNGVAANSNELAVRGTPTYEEAPATGHVTIVRDRSATTRRAFVRYSLLSIGALSLLVGGLLLYRTNFRGVPTAPGPEIKSLAVLPFKSITNQTDDSYLGMGLADTIITRVSQINGLIVRPSSAVQKYNRLDVSSLDAAKELQVDSVLDGTVQRTSDHLRVNLNLLRTRDGASLWSDTFDLKQTDIFKVQDSVSQQVAAHLRLKLRPPTPAHARTVKPQAYEYYLRGLFHTGLQNRADNDAAIELLERAVSIDPNFATAYAVLGRAYRDRAFALKPQEKELEEKAFANVEKALSLDPDLAEGHIARGLLLWTHSNHFPHERVIQEYRRALELNPNADEAHHELASVYNHIGMLDKAADQIQKAVLINPGNTAARFRVGVNLLYRSQHQQALDAFGDSAKFNPGNWAYQTAWALFQLDRKDEAAATIEHYLRDNPQDEGGLLTSMEALFAAAAGDRRKAEKKISRAAEIGKGFGHFHHTAYAIASAYALMNKREQSIDWLEVAANDGFPCYPLFENDRNLINLRRDQRFIAFMGKLKQQWERYQSNL